MLRCNCPNCSCGAQGVSGLANCSNAQYGLPPALSGLSGINFDLTQTVAGGVVGALVGYAAGWDWKLSGAVGAITGGLVLPSLSK